MYTKYIIANRLLKISGALVKALSYPFHWLFPKKRFTIPKQSEPLKKATKQTKIPKIIWQTNYTNEVSLPVYINYLVNRWISPDWEYRYMGHEDREEFIKEHAPKELSEAFVQLTDGAAQADLWRLFVLNFYGGVYMDIDGHSVGSLTDMLDEDDEYCFLLNKEHYTNYFIASAPNNKYLQKAIDLIVNNIQEKNIGRGVYDLTGPNVLNVVIGEDKVNSRYYKYTCIQGSFTNEYFQYIDKPRGKWTYAKNEDLLVDK
ncbi:MAG: glycosyltransferase [Campylobacterota bacterium]|nr:glycosyltransferase [Campylobacterota bacterium]